MTLNWYALKSHPHKEALLAHQVSSRNFEVFYPRLQVKPVNPRSRKIRPYFPGYIFVRADLLACGTSIFQWMPYASGLVSFGGEAAIVPDLLIATLMQKINSLALAGKEKPEEIKAGTPLLIQGGPFEGFEALFDTYIAGSERVRVLLKMLNNRAVRVELPSSQINPRKNLSKK